jgi:hypothetical protein
MCDEYGTRIVIYSTREEGKAFVHANCVFVHCLYFKMLTSPGKRFFNKRLVVLISYNKWYEFSSLTSFLKTKCRNDQLKKLQFFQKTMFASFYWKRRTKSGSFRKLYLLMMDIFSGCRCDELCKMMNCCSYYFQYTNSFL